MPACFEFGLEQSILKALWKVFSILLGGFGLHLDLGLNNLNWCFFYFFLGCHQACHSDS